MVATRRCVFDILKRIINVQPWRVPIVPRWAPVRCRYGMGSIVLSQVLYLLHCISIKCQLLSQSQKSGSRHRHYTTPRWAPILDHSCSKHKKKLIRMLHKVQRNIKNYKLSSQVTWIIAILIIFIVLASFRRARRGLGAGGVPRPAQDLALLQPLARPPTRPLNTNATQRLLPHVTSLRELPRYKDAPSHHNDQSLN